MPVPVVGVITPVEDNVAADEAVCLQSLRRRPRDQSHPSVAVTIVYRELSARDAVRNESLLVATLCRSHPQGVLTEILVSAVAVETVKRVVK